MSNLSFFANGLQDAVTDRGRYDAREMARLLSWDVDEMAQYLGVGVTTIQRGSDARAHQDKLSELAGLVLAVLDAFYGVKTREAPPELSQNPPADLNATRDRTVKRALALTAVWLNTPQPALGALRPKQLILDGKLDVVRDLVREIVAEHSY